MTSGRRHQSRPRRLHGALVAVAVLAMLAACADRSARPAPSTAQRLNGEGLQHLDRGDTEGAEALFREALREAELVDDLGSEGEAWNNLGALAAARGKGAQAVLFHAAALRIHEDGGAHDASEVRTRTNLGSALLGAGRTADAKVQFQQAVALAASLHLPDTSRLARIGLGSACLAEGDTAGALRVADEVSAEARGRSDPASLAAALSLAGTALERAGDLATARSRFEEALSLDRNRAEPRAIADDLHALARVAERQGARRRAASLLTRSARIARQLGTLDQAEDDLRRALALLDGSPPEAAAAVRAELDEITSARTRASR